MLTAFPPPELPGTLTVAVPGLLEHRADDSLALASVGKLLLLAEVARGLTGGTLEADEPVALLDEDYCAGSGLLAKLSARQWTVSDLARLTAAVSDNTATNALLRRVGLDRVNKGAAELGLTQTRILDFIREPRLPEHPPTFAVGTARELAALTQQIAGPAAWARLMLGWMAACADRTMVAGAIPHDPEDDSVPKVPLDRLWVANKTGTDIGMRCDVGVVRGRREVCYAVLGNCTPGREFELLQAMRTIGARIAAFIG
ncbi:serine hydrolase [Streptomyces sp. NPDC052051]|uniref:serine hydrolase n=1 Tax=Streptomyces sp. NPDC052051 TaxID=3154649 RepID=UPI0034180B88